MNLYWFSDEDGELWQIILATDESCAWELLAKNSHSNNGSSLEPGIPIAEAKENCQLCAVTDVSSGRGLIATIFPHEVSFTIRKTPGSEELGHFINI